MKRQRVWVFLGGMLLLVGLAGLALDRFNLAGFSCDSPINTGVTFVEGSGLTYAEAQQAYREAGEALADHRAQEALDLYASIEKPYRRLHPMILLQEASANEQLGNEGKVQERLKKLRQEYANTPFEWMALYRLGQSHMRGRDYPQAKEAFEALLQKTQETSVSYGSHYYLGEIAQEESDPDSAKSHWHEYLKAYTNGTFSMRAAEGLLELPGNKSSLDHQLIGLAYYNEDNFQKALPHLQKAPFGAVWLELGRTTIRTGQVKAGVQLLEKGLHLTDKSERGEAALKAILSTYPATAQQKAKLLQIVNTKPKNGGDFALWQLQKLSSGAERATYGQRLLNEYPTSNWGPETSWELMWPLYKNGNTDNFLVRADKHLKQYPTSISAPRVLFWKSKSLARQGKSALSRGALADLAEKYPYQYYAFRAQQMLNGDKQPWRTVPGTPYPPDSEPGPDPEALARFSGNEAVSPVVVELIAVEAPQDLVMLLQASHKGDIPAPLESIALQQQKQYARSIRIIRDYLDLERKAGKTSQDSNLYKLLYPILYPDETQRYAAQYRLDPYLVQALTRQESYFNPFAVSSSNAMGLMQLLPSTARDVAQWEKMSGFTPTALFNPDTNIRLGSRYLRYLHDTFKGNSMLSVGGYNGGPGAIGRWANASAAMLNSDPDLFIESIPYAQTRDYVKEVFAHYWNYKRLYAADAS